MDEHVAHLHHAVGALLELVARYGELVDAAHAAGLHPALLAGIADAEARADVPGLRAALEPVAGYQACSVPQCGQSTEVVTAALKA